MNGFVMIHHGLILWENGATPLGINFKYLPDLNIFFVSEKGAGQPLGADYSSFPTPPSPHPIAPRDSISHSGTPLRYREHG